MSYQPPSVGPAGLTIPTYTDIITQMQEQFRSINGQNVYLGNDSPDQQLLSVFALMASDVDNAIQLAYNNTAPGTAIGAALSRLVKLNGLFRKAASFSTCVVTISGTAGTVINNGVVQDTLFGKQWNLPSEVTIPGGGSVDVTAICTVPGAFNLEPDTLTIIVVLTAGWNSVTNANPSVPGQPVEADSQLRARQGVSVAGPSTTELASTIAAIAATLDVTRYNVDENFTSATNSNGTPGHSIQAVVEGGTDDDVAQAIFSKRGLGCGTFGTTTVNVVDPNTGLTTPISFDRPTDVPIFVTVTAHLLAGGTTDTIVAMKNALVAYLNSLQIGELVSFGALVAVAMSVNTNISLPVVSVHALTFARTATPTTTTDVIMAFNEVATGVLADIIVNTV